MPSVFRRTTAKMVPANLTRGARRSSFACLEWGILHYHYDTGSQPAADYERDGLLPVKKTLVIYSLWQRTGLLLRFRTSKSAPDSWAAVTIVIVW